jgi:hypothetical protein
MINLFDTVKIISTGQIGTVVGRIGSDYIVEIEPDYEETCKAEELEVQK